MNPRYDTPMHGALIWAMAGLGAWVLWTLATAWILRPGFRGRDPATCITYRLIQAYTRVVHRLRVEGRDELPARHPSGSADRPLVVVVNHTSGVDPLLIQAALPFEVRWVMAEDMRTNRHQWFWEFARIIFVDREAGEALSLREALRHLRIGGTLGVFPEGAIERPPRRLLPFKDGVGFLIARSRALVLPAIVEGTPQARSAWGALFRPSRSRVRFLPLLDFTADKTPADDIADRLQQIYADETRWPLNDQPPKYENGRWWYVAEDGRYRPEE